MKTIDNKISALKYEMDLLGTLGQGMNKCIRSNWQYSFKSSIERL